MWPFSHRRSRLAKRSAQIAGPSSSAGLPSPRLKVRVIGLLTPSYIRVRVSADTGLIDPHEVDWPIQWVPEAARWPNREFVISGFTDGVPQIVPSADGAHAVK
jgi:hypothetical protein